MKAIRLLSVGVVGYGPGANAVVFALDGLSEPLGQDLGLGFRCGR